MSPIHPIFLAVAVSAATSGKFNAQAFQISPRTTLIPITRYAPDAVTSKWSNGMTLFPRATDSKRTRSPMSYLLQNRLVHGDMHDDDTNIDITDSSHITDESITTQNEIEHVPNFNDGISAFVSKVRSLLAPTKSNFKELQSFILAMAIIFLPLLFSPESASAVQSGGRMGGSFGGSSRSSSGKTYSAPSSGYSRGYSRGYSSGYYSRPSVIVSPGISPFYSPFYNPFSWGPGYYSRPGVIVSTGGPSIFSGIFFMVGFFLFASFVMSSVSSGVSNSVGSSIGNALGGQSALGSGVSVAEISVALEVPLRDSPDSILSSLNRLSRTARTDSRVGLQNLTSQVALELLRRKNSIVAASTRAFHYRDDSKAQREFNNITIQQRGKFERETVSKFGGVDYSPRTEKADPLSPYAQRATMAVVTIVVLIDGDSTSKQLSPKINSIKDVESALSRIAADCKVDDCLRGAEILWTPEERDETLTMKDIFADYPSLRSV